MRSKRGARGSPASCSSRFRRCCASPISSIEQRSHQREYFDFFVDALSGRKEAISERHRARFARAYERPEALEAGFDWYRAMQADAERNRQSKPIDVPILYARGNVDGGSPDEYVRGLSEKGARRVSGCVLGGSGELAPLEAPEAFIREVRAFTLIARGEPARSRDGT